MTTLSVPSIALGAYHGGESMAHRCQSMRIPHPCLQQTTPKGPNASSCPFTFLRPNLSPNPDQEADAGTRIPLSGDFLRGFGSKSSSNTTGLNRNPQIGDRLVLWDFDVVFSKRHKTPTQLEPLRQVGDPVADSCVEALKIKPGADALEVLKQYLATPSLQQQADGPREFRDGAFRDGAFQVPDWVDWDIIEQGQQVYWKYVNSITFSLLHYSLVGGFSTPRLAQTLRCTNYLTTSPDRSYQRLMETSQMVHDCMIGGMQSLQPQMGKGWSSIMRVRLLHTQVRLRILSLANSHPDYYSVEENGVPINQEDLVITLCAFSILVIISLERIGISLSCEEEFAYLHVWRLIGHYMGVEPENNPLTSHEDALAAFQSILYHISQPDDLSVHLAHSILRAVADKPPLKQSFEFHSACSRALLGDALSDALQLGSSSLQDRIMVELFFAVLRCPPTPWWTTLLQTWSNWYLQQLTTNMDLNFTMKMMPQLPKFFRRRKYN
ncbi:unnamed protein product [Calypogeia fissa]